MSVPAELKLADCPLLRDSVGVKVADLIEQYQAILQQARDLAAGQFAYLLNRPDVQAIVDDLARVRGQLTRPRYRVGFLGTSQAGKSTTFNNVLKEEIAQSGIGDATTSLITRFRRLDVKSNKFTLRFTAGPRASVEFALPTIHGPRTLVAYATGPPSSRGRLLGRVSRCAGFDVMRVR